MRTQEGTADSAAAGVLPASLSDPAAGGESPAASLRMLLLPVTQRDGELAQRILEREQIETCLCASPDELRREIAAGAGAVMIAEEHLLHHGARQICDIFDDQPIWSDLPLIVLMIANEQFSAALAEVNQRVNLTLMNRPIRIAAFVSAVRSRLRDRQRQYSVRDLLAERDRTQRLVVENERRLSMALKAGGMAAWEWRAGDSIWDKALFELLGIPDDTPPSPEAFFRCVHPDDVAELKAAWTAAIEGTRPYRHEFRIVRPDGQVRWLVGLGDVRRNAAGQVTQIYGMNWDITDAHDAAQALQLSEQRARQASIAKSEFLANMSHEIRTPMTAVLGYTELLAAREDDPEKADFLKIIQRNGSFLLEIINDILDLSKIEAGQMDIARETFSPRRLVEEVRSMMSVRSAEKGIDFHVSFDGLIPDQIDSDPKRLRQILINLVGNAIKFTSEGSVHLAVRYLQQDPLSHLHFDVIDTGIGISEEHQSRLFQVFSQADASITRSFGGTGLGLAISQRLARLLGGSISVASEPGRGSTFSVSVVAHNPGPLRSPDQPQLAEEPKTVKRDPVRLSGRVLVVDDRRDVRHLAAHLLRRAGAEVVPAEDGEHALTIMETAVAGDSMFDLVLLDMQMPRLDGYSTARRLRQMGFTRPIIALTADALDGDRERCLEAGCNGYLSKPIDAGLLLTTVQDLLVDQSDGDRRDPQ